MDFEGTFYSTKDYNLTKKCLDQGVFGKVYLAKSASNDKEYAVKFLNINNGFNGPEQMMFIQESMKFHNLNHPALMKYIGINLQSFEDITTLEPSILTEYFHNGSLKLILDNEKQSIDNPNWNSTKKCITLLGISNAMKYLHKNEIFHQDLKPENIIFDGNYYPLINDYGIAKCFPSTLSKMIILTLTKNFGTPIYIAPELFEEEEKEKNKFQLQADVYSFGIIAHEILTGQEPYSELGKLSSAKLAAKIISGYRPQFTEDVPEKMKSLILRCLSKNIEERPSFDQIFSELSNYDEFFNDDLDKNEINKYLKVLSNEAKDVKVSTNTANTANKNKDNENDLENEIAFEKEQIIKKIDNDRNYYAEIIKILARNVSNLNDLEIEKVHFFRYSKYNITIFLYSW